MDEHVHGGVPRSEIDRPADCATDARTASTDTPAALKTLTDEDIVRASVVPRRAMLTALGASLFGATAIACASPSSLRGTRGHLLKDPVRPTSDPVRTGISDSDPYDRAGYGRGGHYGRGAITDNDPDDPAGHGRGTGTGGIGSGTTQQPGGGNHTR